MEIRIADDLKKLPSMPLESFAPYPNNAKKHDIENIAKSIREFGFNDCVSVYGDGNIIIEGHGRLEAMQLLGAKEMPYIRLTHLTEEQSRAYRILHNDLNMRAGFDDELLEAELKALSDIEFDMSDFGFDFKGEEPASGDEYTKKIKSPQYEITGEQVDITDLTCDAKYKELIDGINKSGLPEEQKSFLRFAACRHIAFDFHKIAEYYAGADNEMQGLMEQSALVIIDFDDAIKNGYVKLSATLDDLMQGASIEED